jgi:hypothetical protein
MFSPKQLGLAQGDQALPRLDADSLVPSILLPTFKKKKKKIMYY